ncbi:MAG: amidase [Haliscomenobacter sp.]|nr:amidase [Haliscomenobacter sp.]
MSKLKKNNPLFRPFGRILWLAILVGLWVCSCGVYRHPKFSKRDIRSAQRVIGFNFSKNHRDTMYRYLGSNLNGYDTMTTFKLDYQTPPALYFDPRPDGFILPMRKDEAVWGLPENVDLPANQQELTFYPISSLATLIRTRQITSESLTRLFLERMRKYDPTLKAVVTLLEERALAQAKKADAEIAAGRYRSPLHGIPYGVKDLMALPGYPTTWGSAPYQNQMLDHTASVIEQLDSAGAVLLAKLTSGSLARGDIWFGGQTRNPWDTLQGASGSSAGSASAVAAGLCAFAIGTETLGSIVAPSARCGATGLRPTYGRVSRYGAMTLSWTMDKVGPICRDARDCALVLDAIRGEDGKDRTVENAPFAFHAGRNPQTLRVAYLKAAFEKDTTSAGKNNLAALEVFRNMGIELQEVSLPEGFPYSAFDIILRAESGAFFDELIRSGRVDLLEEQHRGSRANSLRQSRFIPAPEYLQANRHRKALIEAMDALMKNCDVVLAPPGGSEQNLITNLTGHPALALPTGWDQRNRPTSITLLGNLYDEAAILELGWAYQKTTVFEETHPPLFAVPTGK